MTKNMDDLLTRMIRLYGFEHRATKLTAVFIERRVPYEVVKEFVEAHECNPEFTGEEDWD